MDAMGESKSLPEKIEPPRLEDAGLEDCALPPDSIMEAFLKAASAVGPVVSASEDEDDSVYFGTADRREDISEDVLAGKNEKVAAGEGDELAEVFAKKASVDGGPSESKSDALVVPGSSEVGVSRELQSDNRWEGISGKK